MLSVSARIEKLKKDNVLLLKQLDALEAEIVGAEPARKVLLETQIEDVEKTLTRNEGEIKRLQETGVSQQLLDDFERDMVERWEEQKYFINFKQSFRRVTHIVAEFAEGGAVLFLLPESRDRMAELYLTRVEKWLREDFGYVPFSYQWDATDPGLINVLVGRLAVWLDMQTSCEVGAVIDKLVTDRLESGAIFYLKLEFKRTIPADFFDSFLNDFWLPLVERVTQLAETKPLRMLTFIVARLRLPADHPPHALRNPQPHVQGDRYTVMLLEDWQRDDVRDWLVEAVRPTRFKLHATLVDELIESAFDAPRTAFDIYSRLDKDWKDIVKTHMEKLRDAQLATVQVSR